MARSSIEALLSGAVSRVGMKLQKSSPYGIGQYYLGNGILSEGTFWYYCHQGLYSISICDFVALRDCPLYMPATRYLALRWSEAGRLPKGQLTSYLEEKGGEAHATLTSGTHVAYVEILYMAEYYERYLQKTVQSYAEYEFSSVMKVLEASGQWSAAALRVFRDIKEYGGRGFAAELYFQSEAMKLMSLLIQSRQQISEMEQSDLLGLTAVTDYISSNLEKELTQKELAYISRMSASKLKIVFKEFTGKTLSGYIKAKRMEKAEELLTNTVMSIEEIAMQIGFRTSAGFVTAFHKHTGHTPGSFRKLMSFHCNTNPSAEYQHAEKLKALSEEWR